MQHGAVVRCLDFSPTYFLWWRATFVISYTVHCRMISPFHWQYLPNTMMMPMFPTRGVTYQMTRRKCLNCHINVVRNFIGISQEIALVMIEIRRILLIMYYSQVAGECYHRSGQLSKLSLRYSSSTNLRICTSLKSTYETFPLRTYSCR